MPDAASFHLPPPDEDDASPAVPELVLTPALSDPALYLNRELSWLAFNGRVLSEAADPAQPLLERVKFIAITHSNLDEYYMVRVSGLQQQVAAGMTDVSPDGMTSAEQGWILWTTGSSRKPSRKA